MSTKIAFHCPACQSQLIVSPEHAGAKVPCPKCGQRLQVPTPPPENPHAERNRTILGAFDVPPRAGLPPTARAAAIPARKESVSAARPKPPPRPTAARPAAPRTSPGTIKPIWFWAAGGAAALGLLLFSGLLIVLVSAFRGPSTQPPVPVKPSPPDAGQNQNPQSAHAADLTPEDIFRRYSKSVAVIKSSLASGSGLVVAPNLVATNAHVVEDAPADGLQVYFPSSDRDAKNPIKVDLVVHYDRKTDLALLRVSTGSAQPLDVTTNYDFTPGQAVTAIGSPGFGQGLLENAVSAGVMSAKHNENGRVRYQMNMAVNPGNSGGPLFDNHGRVIGVVVAKATNKEEISFAVTCEDLHAAMAEVAKQSENDARKASTDFDLDVVFRGVRDAGGRYATALKIYGKALTDPDNEKVSADDILANARHAIDGYYKEKGMGSLNALNEALLNDVKPTLMRMGKNSNIPAKTFDSLMDLWSVYLDMKKCTDSPPPGKVGDFLNKIREMRDKYDNLVQTLKVRLGVEDPD